MALEMTLEEFEKLVETAIDELPQELVELVENCVLMVQEDAPDDAPGLLGLYEGIPLTERDSGYSMALPDRISIYMRPTLEICESVADVVAEIRITVAHEIAHHFGIDDERLGELGYS